MKQPVYPFEHGARTDKALPRQQRRADAGLRRPAGVQPLGPGAFGEIFDDAARHAAGDPERVHDLSRVQSKRRADACGRAHRAEDCRRMKSGLVHGLRHNEAETAEHLGAHRNPRQRHAAIRIVPLARSEHRRHDDRTGMDRPALESIVEILAMRRGTVDKGRARGRQRTLVADDRAGSVVVAARERAARVVLVARGDAEASDVNQQILAFAQRRRRQNARRQACDFLRQGFGDRSIGKRSLGKLVAHIADQTWNILV